MEIAVLGWGSLVWQPMNAFGSLAVRSGSRWATDGPVLPVEFARISGDGRLTLVIVPRLVEGSTVLWVNSDHTDLESARANVAARETGAPLEAIHAVTRTGEVFGSPDGSTVVSVAEWLHRNRHLDAAIWTGLPPGDRWVEFGYEGFTIPAAVDYVTGLQGDVRTRALEYVRNAPRQIDTPVRRALSEIVAR